MIISHTKKFCFFRVTKTGSTTAQVMLRLTDAFDTEKDILTAPPEWKLPAYNVREPLWKHSTPQDAVDAGVITVDQLMEYDCYAFVRDVDTRFVSAYHHANPLDGPQPKTFLKRMQRPNQRNKLQGLVGRPQVDWFHVNGIQVVTPLDFADYANELKKIIYPLGGNRFENIPHLNISRHDGKIKGQPRKEWAERVWDYSQVQEEVYKIYAADRAFYERSFKEK